MPPVNTPQSPSAVCSSSKYTLQRPRNADGDMFQRTPSRPQTPSHNRPLTPLSYLSSPAPDLAATLHATSHAADQADEANVSFLRRTVDSLERVGSQLQQQRGSHVDAQRDPRREGHAGGESGAGGGSGETAEDSSRRQRLQRVLARLNRFHEPGTASSTSAAYTNRTPSPNRQTIYDWAPSYDDAEEAGGNELDAILDELRRQQPDTHPDILRVLGQSQLDGSHSQQQQHREARERDMADAVAAERRNRVRERERRITRESEWASLRSRAAMQRARQEGAGSPSATERMLRYVMERERSGMSEEEERARGGGWFRPSPSRGSGEETQRVRDYWALPPPVAELRDRDRQERVDAFRRGYLAENVPPRLPRISTPPVPAGAHPAATNTSSSSAFLENALKYLSELRGSTSYEEALSTAIDHGLATKEFFADKHDDFVMDLDEVPPLPWTSWLQPGTIFEGHQHATGCGPGGVTQQEVGASRSRIEQINPHFNANDTEAPTHIWDPQRGRYESRESMMLRLAQELATHHASISNNPSSSYSPAGAGKTQNHDHWPVRVVIHSIDPEKMTLQGTMEAYDVPQHTPNHLPTSEPPKAGKKSAPITTYLEGHIIDFRTHSLLTPDTSPAASRSEGRGPREGPHMTSATNMTPYTTIPTAINFPSASAKTDGENWLRLPPFNHTPTPTSRPSSSSSSPPPDDLARTLVSTASLAHLTTTYILMRWKEKNFIHTSSSTCTAPASERATDQDRGHGLTISGFYYVSLCRETGEVEGVYFDPGSTPCQFLRLQGGKGGGWGAWGMK